MSRVYHCADLHIGHKGIHKYREYVTDVEHNTEFVIEQWFDRIKERDKVIIHGDAIFHSDYLSVFERLPGTKVLVLGNHDLEASDYDYVKLYSVFKEVYAFKRRGKLWLSHAPIHTVSLRDGYCIHGHQHSDFVRLPNGKIDKRYMNVNMDVLYPHTGSIFIDTTRARDLLTRGRTYLNEKEWADAL